MKKLAMFILLFCSMFVGYGQRINNEGEKMVAAIHFTSEKTNGPYSYSYDLNFDYDRNYNIKSVTCCFENNKVILNLTKDHRIERKDYVRGKSRPNIRYEFKVDSLNRVSVWDIYDMSEDHKTTGLMEMLYEYNSTGNLSSMTSHSYIQQGKNKPFLNNENGVYQTTKIDWVNNNSVVGLLTSWDEFGKNVKVDDNIYDVEFCGYQNDTNLELSSLMYNYTHYSNCFGPESLLQLVGWVPVKSYNMPSSFKIGRRVNVKYVYDNHDTLYRIELYKPKYKDKPMEMIGTIDIEYVK